MTDEPKTSPTAEDEMEGYVGPDRIKMPDERPGITHRVEIGGMEGYIIANPQPDGRLGEVFIAGFGQDGSTLQGWTQAFAIMLSIGLQFGAEFPMLVRKFAHMKFEPNGYTDNREIPHCQSVPDYMFKWLARKFGTPELVEELAKIDRELSRK